MGGAEPLGQGKLGAEWSPAAVGLSSDLHRPSGRQGQGCAAKLGLGPSLAHTSSRQAVVLAQAVAWSCEGRWPASLDPAAWLRRRLVLRVGALKGTCVNVSESNEGVLC